MSGYRGPGFKAVTDGSLMLLGVLNFFKNFNPSLVSYNLDDFQCERSFARNTEDSRGGGLEIVPHPHAIVVSY